MDITFIIGIILITASSFSVVCQVIGLLGHGWFGFTMTMAINGTKIKQHVDSGLFYRSPYEICIDVQSNGTVCTTPDQFPPGQRKMFEVLTNTLDERFDSLKALVITGLAVSAFAVALLYTYMCMSRKYKKEKCIGITCAVFWAFAALADIAGFAIEMSRYKDGSNGLKHLEEIYEVSGISVEGKIMTPWAAIILGIGSVWALIVVFVVALTTCGKRFNKTVIIYSELKNGEKDGLMSECEDEDG